MKREDMRTSKLSALFAWLDNHILLLFVTVLIVLVPLLPKIPLADILPGYIVRVRTEDVLIAAAFGLWGIQLLRKKISIRTPLTKIILAYLVVGLLSSISAIFITKTVPQSEIHIQKLFLHYFRRVEYFSLFFLAASAITSVRQIKRLLALFLIAVFAVNVYGLGQKYLYWPVYSTMNREFSKGLRLYLTEHARVQSTFGGHYDYAAFLVIGLPFVLAFLFTVKHKGVKLFLFASFITGLWGMMMTASRSSFLALLLSFALLFVFWLKKRGVLWVIPRSFFTFFFVAVTLFTFGTMSERFAQIFRDNATYASLQATIDDVKQKAQAPLIAPPKEAISIDDVTRAAEEAAKKELAEQAARQGVVDVTDTLPSVFPGQTQELPPDVFLDIPAAVVSTKSAEGKDIEVVIPRVFSENAHRLGLSAAIRLDTLWPFAIRGFLRNPLLGSGYSTLTKYSIGEFTEAESTDNDFLRTLGETGLLGFLTFYGTMIVALRFMLKTAQKHKDEVFLLYAFTMLAVTAGLFVNAVYIDVFVSSKVIQTYWLLTGLGIAWGMMLNKREATIKVETKPAAKKVSARKHKLRRSV